MKASKGKRWVAAELIVTTRGGSIYSNDYEVRGSSSGY